MGREPCVSRGFKWTRELAFVEGRDEGWEKVMIAKKENCEHGRHIVPRRAG